MSDKMKHINRYTMILTMCRFKIKNLYAFDSAIYRPFSEYINFFEEIILESIKTDTEKSTFLYENNTTCKTIISKLLKNDTSKTEKKDITDFYETFSACTNITPNVTYEISYLLKCVGIFTFIIFGLLLFPVWKYEAFENQSLLLNKIVYSIIPLIGLVMFFIYRKIEQSFISPHKNLSLKLRYGINYRDCFSNLEEEFGYLLENLEEPKSKYSNMTIEEKQKEFFKKYNKAPENFFIVLKKLPINDGFFLSEDFELNSQIDFPLFITYLKTLSSNNRNSISLLHELFNIPKEKNISQYAREYNPDKKGKDLKAFSQKIQTESTKFSIKIQK
ncbi:MAG: hypothetical protein UH788_10645 [Treponemataceae bacterium]|nr:hypothetical protein [Treponemataceae bacterium]